MSSRDLRTLLKYPPFRRQFLKPPRITPNLAHGKPWVIWALTYEGRWAKAETVDYAGAFAIVKRGLAKKLEVDGVEVPAYKDFSIVSLRQFHAPMAGLKWDPTEGWCSRCRRPVVFGYFRRHHGRVDSPMKDSLGDDPRCPYCGIRREAMKEYPNNGG